MSKLSRYNLLISLIRSELRYEHVLALSEKPEHNQLLYRRSIEAWIFLTDDLMCENFIQQQARDTRIKNLLHLLNKTSTSLTLLTLKRAYDFLINHISQKRIITDYLDFKGLFDDDEQSIIGLLFSPIKESLNSVIHSQTVVCRGCYNNDATRDLKCCAQYLMFLSKINFEGVGLEEKATLDYLAFEAETSQLELSNCEPYIPALQTILKEWLSDWNYDGLRSKHGPGSVADSTKDKFQKYLHFATDNRTSYLYQNDKEVIDTILPFGGLVRSLERCSKLVFVPKNITKLRTISMEPVTLQYLQQGCMESLYDYFDSHRVLSKILQLKDQSQNQSFAYHGSITNDYATIDLSHASDSVNWNLTKALFARVPQLLRWLVCTRSTHTLLPDGTKLALAKYAPMGSALCFPIESLIFAAIAELSIRLAKEQALDRNSDTGVRSRYTYLTVYGDDIILPTFAANKCIALLRLFGFTPNEDKSYLDGPFKESCGGNYFCGFDITPIKFAPSYDTAFEFGVSPEAYTALCSYANLAYAKGYSLFRLYCIKSIFESGHKPLFTDSLDESPAIYSPTPTNFHLKKVYIKRYQKYQILYTGVKTVEKRCSESVKDHIGHIFLYDYMQQLNYSRKVEVTSLLNQAGASISKGSIIYDTKVPYARKTLLPQVFMYTMCKKDYEHSNPKL